MGTTTRSKNIICSKGLVNQCLVWSIWSLFRIGGFSLIEPIRLTFLLALGVEFSCGSLIPQYVFQQDEIIFYNPIILVLLLTLELRESRHTQSSGWGNFDPGYAICYSLGNLALYRIPMPIDLVRESCGTGLRERYWEFSLSNDTHF